ncbi:MAG: hypothetical protein HY291_17355 [Planctomycetes bacterium]|nr:hypothetical protein [Planctomycetota bacterium]
MAVNFATPDPAALLARFREAIGPKALITSWREESGKFTQTDKRFEGRAWFTPVVTQGRLTFLLDGDGEDVSHHVWANYHGQLIETFLFHFDSRFTNVDAPQSVPAYRSRSSGGHA